MTPAEDDRPRPTAGAGRPELEELLQGVRRGLAARDEDPTGLWVEESATELARGRRPGWYLPGVGLAFYAQRGTAAFGHVHASGGAPVALRLAETLRDGLPREVASLDLGFTGLSAAEEGAVATELAHTPRSAVIQRRGLDRPLSSEDATLAAEPPAGTERLPVGAVTVEALAELDRQAFRGSTDELLLGNDPEAHRRSLEALLEGRLGRFLAEASCAVVEPEPLRLVGAVLTAERSSRRAIILDLMVDPARRRHGLGRFLLGWSLRALLALGYESARLWVSVDNAAAVGLYRAFGFRTALEATIYRWDRPATDPQPQVSR